MVLTAPKRVRAVRRPPVTHRGEVVIEGELAEFPLCVAPEGTDKGIGLLAHSKVISDQALACTKG